MPGIVGIISRPSYEGASRDLQLMSDTTRHEAHYVGNRYINEDIGLHIAWWSHPLSLGERMPIVSDDKRIVLLVVGDHFSHDHEVASNERENRSRELLSLYQESQDGLLNSLNGWFCGVAVDLNQETVTIFNDRYGMGRIYFHQGESEFLFASEAKALLRIRPTLRKIEPKSLAQYLRFNCVIGNGTLFKGISLLPGASAWTFAGEATPRKRSYFDYADWEKQPIVSAQDFQQKFDDTVSGIAPAYMGEGKKVGLSLTAGLDTRAILAAAMEQELALPCYTFGGLWGETFDIRTARKLARACNLRHDSIRINEQFLHEFPDYAKKSVYISDGTHDVLGAHDVYFNEVARKIAPIRLTGKFGSEVVRTRRLIPSVDFPRHFLQPWFLPLLDGTSIDVGAQSRHPLSRVVGEEIAWYEYGRVAVEQSQIILRTPYMDNDLVKLMYQAPFELRASRRLQAQYVRGRNHALGDVPTNMGRVRENGQLAGKIAYSLFWALFKVEFIYLYATPHWMTRLDRQFEVLKPETIIAGRQKFEGYRIWFKTHLADYLRDVLLSPSTGCTDFFEKAWVEKAVTRHIAGTHNYLNEINKMLTIELVCSSLLGG